MADSGQVVQVESTEFPDGLDTGVEERAGCGSWQSCMRGRGGRVGSVQAG